MHDCTADLDCNSCLSNVQIVAVDPGQRGASEGVQVMSGAPFLLQHCATKQVSHCPSSLGTCGPQVEQRTTCKCSS